MVTYQILNLSHKVSLIYDWYIMTIIVERWANHQIQTTWNQSITDRYSNWPKSLTHVFNPDSLIEICLEFKIYTESGFVVRSLFLSKKKSWFLIGHCTATKPGVIMLSREQYVSMIINSIKGDNLFLTMIEKWICSNDIVWSIN